MSQVVRLHLPEDTANRLKMTARRDGKTVNEVASRSIEEWLRQEEFAEIEFRSFNGERHACLQAALPLWQFISVARGYDMDAEKTAAHFDFPLHRVKAAFHYYEAYPQEIDQAIADNDSMTFEMLERLLPQIEVISIEASMLEAE